MTYTEDWYDMKCFLKICIIIDSLSSPYLNCEEWFIKSKSLSNEEPLESGLVRLG